MAGSPRPLCLCSTVDYQSPAWSGDYYPEECPEEWRLAYFMNDFPGVYLPAASWTVEQRYLELVDELEGDFQLVLEWPSSATISESRLLLDKLKPISANVVSLVLGLEAAELDTSLPLLQLLTASYPVSIDSRSGFDAHQSARLEALGIGQVWFPARQAEPVSAGNYLVVRLPVIGLREIREVLDQAVKVVEQGTGVGLFIEPAQQAPQRAKEVRTIIELLELA